jgi:hypothetical protein
MIHLIATFIFCIMTVVSGQEIVLFDYQPFESFLSVYLNIYDMNIVHPTHSNRINSVLGNFETDPSQLYDDEICFGIVIEAIILGFEPGFDSFFFERSRRLLTRILQSNPNRNVILQLLFLISEADLPDIVQAICNYFDGRAVMGRTRTIYSFFRADSSSFKAI